MHRINKNRLINEATGRSVITDGAGKRYELIPRASLDELFEISAAMPAMDMSVLAKYSAEPDKEIVRDRYYKIIIGAGAHSKARLAREINNDGTYGRYVVVKKVRSSEELIKEHSSRLSQNTSPTPDKLARADSLKTLSKSTTLPVISRNVSDDNDVSDMPKKDVVRSASTPLAMRIFGDSKRKAILDSIHRELHVNTLLTGLDNICLSESQIRTTKKHQLTETQLYQFMPYATLGTLNHFKEHLKNTLFNFENANKLRVNFANQMINIIRSLHTKSNVRHRDIKPDNFLLTADGKVLLTDFGAAAYPSDKQDGTWEIVSNTSFFEYTPPAYLMDSTNNQNDKYRMHDEWALATSILELWGIDTSPLVEILKLGRLTDKDGYYRDPETRKIKIEYNSDRASAAYNEIQHIYYGSDKEAGYKDELLELMDEREIPSHIQTFILAALEVDLHKRNKYAIEVVDENSLRQSPEISEQLERIHKGIKARNIMFFQTAEPTNNKYKIGTSSPPRDDMQIGYTDYNEPYPDPTPPSPPPTQKKQN